MSKESLELYRAQIFWLRSKAYEALNWNYRSPGVMPNAVMPLRAYGMLYTQSGRFKSHGMVSGKAQGGQNFSLSDLTASADSETGYAGFGGVILSLEHPVRFLGRTIICGDRGPLNPKFIEEMKRVGMVDSNFEDRFEVYSDDQVQSRALITPDFMERLMQLQASYFGRNIQCAFLLNQLHLCLEIDDRFDFNGERLFDSFESARDIVLSEMAAVCQLLEFGQTLQAAIGAKGASGADETRRRFYTELVDTLRTALDSPPTNWNEGPKIDPDMKYYHYLFDGYLGLMSQSIFRPLGSKE